MSFSIQARKLGIPFPCHWYIFRMLFGPPKRCHFIPFVLLLLVLCDQLLDRVNDSLLHCCNFNQIGICVFGMLSKPNDKELLVFICEQHAPFTQGPISVYSCGNGQAFNCILSIHTICFLGFEQSHKTRTLINCFRSLVLLF